MTKLEHLPYILNTTPDIVQFPPKPSNMESLDEWLRTVIETEFLLEVKIVLEQEGIIEGRFWRKILKSLTLGNIWWRVPLRCAWLCAIREKVIEEESTCNSVSTLEGI